MGHSQGLPLRNSPRSTHRTPVTLHILSVSLSALRSYIMATPAFGAQASTEAEPNNAALYESRRRQTDSGTIEREEFLSLPQVSSNPLATRMIAIFDEDGGGDVDFQEFVLGLSAFSAKGHKEEQLQQIVD